MYEIQPEIAWTLHLPSNVRTLNLTLAIRADSAGEAGVGCFLSDEKK
jgi:hypothetical protein